MFSSYTHGHDYYSSYSNGYGGFSSFSTRTLPAFNPAISLPHYAVGQHPVINSQVPSPPVPSLKTQEEAAITAYKEMLDQCSSRASWPVKPVLGYYAISATGESTTKPTTLTLFSFTEDSQRQIYISMQQPHTGKTWTFPVPAALNACRQGSPVAQDFVNAGVFPMFNATPKVGTE